MVQIPPLQYSFTIVSIQSCKLHVGDTHDNLPVLYTASVGVVLAATEGASATSRAQITSAEVLAAAGLEGEAVDGSDTLSVDWGGGDHERRDGQEEDLGELHVEGLRVEFCGCRVNEVV